MAVCELDLQLDAPGRHDLLLFVGAVPPSTGSLDPDERAATNAGVKTRDRHFDVR